jgi:hypothetical protein
MANIRSRTREVLVDDISERPPVCAENAIHCCELDFDVWTPAGEHPAMSLSFLYRAFCRVLQLIRFFVSSNTDRAMEVVMLRQEVAILRRQVHRPALELR